MATLLQIHSPKVKDAFEQPPPLLPADRDQLFALPPWAETYVSTLHTAVSQLGFILQVGYFRATHRFFPVGRYAFDDIHYVISRYQLELEAEELGGYSTATHWRHQGLICQQLGYIRFANGHRDELRQEAQRLCRSHTRPDELFDYLISYLEERRIEIPSYRTFAELITQALLSFEEDLLLRLKRHLTPADETRLSELLQPYEPNQSTDPSSVKRYTLTHLKRMSQSLRAGAISERVIYFGHLKTLYEGLSLLIERLQLPDASVRYFAEYVLRAQPAQLYRRDQSRYLYLIGFVVHQYAEWSDALVDTLLQSVSHFFSQCESRLKEQYYEERQDTARLTQQVTDRSRQHVETLIGIRQLIQTGKEPADQTLAQIHQLVEACLPSDEQAEADQQALDQLVQVNDRYHHQDAYYNWLAKHSIQLQRKVSALLRVLVVDETRSQKDFVQALQYFQQHSELGATTPTGFLPIVQQGKILDEKGRLRVSLYKVLLFYHLTLAIKSGQVNLLHSYRYRAFERYLIPPEQWQRERAELLGRANLTEYIDSAAVLKTLADQLDETFTQTNERILIGANPHVTHKNDKLVVETPKTALDSLISPYEIFPANKVISLQAVLATIDELTHFTDALTHWQPKHIPKRPAKHLFWAGVMALGCNVGVRRMAQIARPVSENALDELVKWYCTLENLRQANDLVLLYTRDLKLRIHLKDSPDLTYTSSDGQKLEVAGDSLLARSSFKYFGNRKGIAAYDYTDDTLLLFDSQVFSAGDREATYLMNGLVHTNVLTSDVHSSDSHGYNEVTFAGTYFINVRYEPRIKNFLRQQLYSFKPVAHYKGLQYPILPAGRINPERIEPHWDQMLRLMTTIRLHYSQPSELFNRLNSYARQHQLYQAMKEFGRIIKTVFLLRYTDQVELRQRVQRQLNRGESVHHLANSVWFGRHGQMGWVTPSDQAVANTAKRLIMNCIICYNYLHISEHLTKLADREQRRDFLGRLSKLTMLTHHHINFNGLYDFSEAEQLATPFDIGTISDLEI